MDTKTEPCATPITEERLEALGLTAASNSIKQVKKSQAQMVEFSRKCTIAYENYRYVKQEKIDEFNAELRKKTEGKDGRSYHYDALVFTRLEHFNAIPPTDVLDLLETAKGRNCFDYFEVAKIERVVKTPDPILFGCIDGCKDRFFVGQWDNDVKIEDLLKPNEG